MSIELVMPSSHLILCRPLLLLPPIPLSIRVFSNESTLHMRWPKYWSFSFSISPSKEHPGLISFRVDWLDILAVQGTLKSLLQHHSSNHQFWGYSSVVEHLTAKASILRCLAFFDFNKLIYLKKSQNPNCTNLIRSLRVLNMVCHIKRFFLTTRNGGQYQFHRFCCFFFFRIYFGVYLKMIHVQKN